MKDYLLDLIQHTNGLGVVELGLLQGDAVDHPCLAGQPVLPAHAGARIRLSHADQFGQSFGLAAHGKRKGHLVADMLAPVVLRHADVTHELKLAPGASFTWDGR